MMYSLLATAGTALYKRAAEGPGNGGDGGDGAPHYQLPSWSWMVALADLVVFFPVLLYLGYTLNHVYPTLAIVEDPKPPAYEPVSLNADTESLAEDDAGGAAAPKSDGRGGGQSHLVTASLRRTNRLLHGTAGWTANFRGLGCAVALRVVVGLAAGVFSAVPFVPGFVGTLLASLATVQLSTAWTHAVIAAPSPLRWWRRLPPLRRTFEATCAPVVLYWAAATLSTGVPLLAARAMGVPAWNPGNPGEVPEYRASTTWKALVVLLITLAFELVAVVPAQILLVRVQASLLPPEEDTIVPFDRSFAGAVEPALVGGKGYVSLKDAFKTFPAASWGRLYLLFAKVLGIALAVHAVMAVIVIPEVVLMIKHSTPAV